MTASTRILFMLLASPLLLVGCDLPFLEDPQAAYEAKREAEGKAVGSACRHSGRALEECYDRNPKISKAAIFNGWRDMDGYMRENNIQVVLPEAAPDSAEKSGEKAEEKPKAAEAPADEAKQPKAAAAPAGKKAAQATGDAPTKQNLVAPSGKVAKHIA